MNKKAKTNASEPKSTSAVLAKSDDGTIQITLTIPYSEIKKNEEVSLEELGKNLEIPGFRKGLAPKDKVKSNISAGLLTQKTLEKILPRLFADVVKEHNLKPVILPKFELISHQINEDWQVRLITCEIPEIELGNYKEMVRGALKTKSIWTPQKGESINDKKEVNSKEKTNEVIRVLLGIEVKIPKVLLEEEANLKLSKLLESLEKLGLTLENYLSSIGKSPDSLRKEYEKNAEKALKLDLILGKIADKENIVIHDKKIDETLKTAQDSTPGSSNLNTDEQKRTIASILRKRAALDSLLALV